MPEVRIARRRGRPRVAEPRTASVTTWLPPKQADRLIQVANARNVSVSSLVRSAVVIVLDTKIKSPLDKR